MIPRLEGRYTKWVAELETVLKADKIVPLGFIFHDLNMDLLRSSQKARESVNDHRQSLPSQLRTACTLISKSLKMAKLPTGFSEIIIDDAKCVDFFDRYGRGFATS